MAALVLERQPQGKVTVDVCGTCGGLWFDASESPQLSRAATRELLAHVAALGTTQRAPASAPACPRCGKRLAHTHDVQRTTRFAYWRCANGHGRFTPFAQFLREKDFVRPLGPEEIARLRALIGSIRCSGCGAPVDLGHHAACPYCGGAIEGLDPEAIRRALASLDPVAPRAMPAAAAAAFDAALAAATSRSVPAGPVDLLLEAWSSLVGRGN
jgi:DNA-directed RNA polymerase subunit RPC12/RpoP